MMDTLPVQVTQEFSKNPEADMTLHCHNCGHEGSLAEFLREEPLPEPYTSVLEGFMLCPRCHFRTHNYYLPESLRFSQSMLKRALLRWQRDKTTSSWAEYERRQRVFQRNFETAQQKYKTLMEKETSHE